MWHCRCIYLLNLFGHAAHRNALCSNHQNLYSFSFFNLFARFTGNYSVISLITSFRFSGFQEHLHRIDNFFSILKITKVTLKNSKQGSQTNLSNFFTSLIHMHKSRILEFSFPSSLISRTSLTAHKVNKIFSRDGTFYNPGKLSFLLRLTPFSFHISSYIINFSTSVLI